MPEFRPNSWLRGTALLVLTLLAYAPSYLGERLWDDTELVFENALIQRADGLGKLWFSTMQPDYYPITWTTFWMERRLWGDDPTGYRVTNVLLHAVAAVLLWRLLLRLSVPGAWLAAALFALHPVCVASAAWISQRKNTLSLVFFLLSLLAYVRFDESRRRNWYILALGAFLAAMLSKVSVVALPVVLLGIIWARRGRLTRRDFADTAPFFVIGLGLAAVGMWFQSTNAIGADEVRPEGIASRILAAGWIVWFYLYTALLPANLAMVYPRWSVDPANPLHYLPLLALLLLIGVLWMFRRSWARGPLLALGYVLVVLAPVAGILSMAYAKISLVSDHLQYIAIPGVTALLAALPLAALERSRNSAAGPWRTAFAACAAGLLLTFGALTFQRAGIFAVHERMWNDTLARYPEAWMAHQNLGVLLLRRGELVAAEPHMREVLRAQPGFAAAHGNLGTLLVRSGRLDDGIAEFRTAIRLNPKHTPSYLALAEIARQQGRHGEAAEFFGRAAALSPFDVGVRNRWAAELIADGRPAAAVPVMRSAIDLDPHGAALYYNLGFALDLSGDVPAAEAAYREALRIQPQEPDALNRLAALLATRPGATAEDFQQALDMSRRAVSATNRQNAEILYDHACLLNLGGMADESAKTAREALDVARRTNDTAQIERITRELGTPLEPASAPSQASPGP